MRPVSSEYRRAVQQHRTGGVRPGFGARVYLGMIDSEAKPDSQCEMSEGTAFSDADNMYWEKTPVVTSYATFEKGLTRLGSSQCLLPQAGEYRAQGFVAARCCDGAGHYETEPELDITFGEAHSIVGLSFDFDGTAGAPPRDFVVESYRGDSPLQRYEITDNTEADYRGEMPLTGFDRLRIRFTAGQPFTRVRIGRIEYGVGYSYISGDLLSLSHRRSGHPLSLELPANEVRFTLYNDDGRFAVDSESSHLRFLKKGQPVLLSYGCEVEAGKYEWIDAFGGVLDSWETNGIRTTLTACDSFVPLAESDYKRAVYDGAAHTVAELAGEVLRDAGVQAYDVGCWSAAHTLTQRPLPVASHGECLQLLANLALCSLEQEPKGKIRLKNRMIPDGGDWEMTGSPTAAEMPWSNAAATAEGGAADYACFERDRTRLGAAEQRLAPADGGAAGGYAVNVYPDEEGRYRVGGEEVCLTARFGRAVDFCRLTVRFAQACRVERVRVVFCGDEGDRQQCYEVTDGIAEGYGRFENITGLRLVAEGGSGCRLGILQLDIGPETGLQLTKGDVLGMQKEALAAATRQVQVLCHRAYYWPEPYETELERVWLRSGEVTEVAHPEVYYRVRAHCDDSRVRFVMAEHYAHHSILQIAGGNAETEVLLLGAALAKSNTTRESTAVGEEGSDVVIDNPVLGLPYHAAKMAEWAAGYYRGRLQYELVTLGYPEIDAGDVVLYEGRPMTVLENNIEMDGGTMRGTMRLRGG